MIKYINTEKFRILVPLNNKLITLNPGESLEVESPIISLSRYLVDEPPAKKVETQSDPVKEEQDELIEDLIVLVSDSIIEELKQEQQKTPKKRSSRRRGK